MAVEQRKLIVGWFAASVSAVSFVFVTIVVWLAASQIEIAGLRRSLDAAKAKPCVSEVVIDVARGREFPAQEAIRELGGRVVQTYGLSMSPMYDRWRVGFDVTSTPWLSKAAAALQGVRGVKVYDWYGKVSLPNVVE